MEQLREWCRYICFAAIGCSAIQLLIPKGRTGKLFRLLTLTFFLCSMILPFFKLTSSLPLNIEFLPEDIVSEQLSDKVTEQLRGQVEQVVKQVAEDCLANRGVTAEKIVVQTDIADSGSIYIQQVTVFVDKQSLAAALPIRDVLKTQLETTVYIQVSE